MLCGVHKDLHHEHHCPPGPVPFAPGSPQPACPPEPPGSPSRHPALAFAEAARVTALLRDSHATCTLRGDRTADLDGTIHQTISLLGQVRM